MWLNSLELQVLTYTTVDESTTSSWTCSTRKITEIPTSFRDAFHRMYMEAQVIAIRRQADDDPRTLSLRRLIGQLENHRREFTRAWYVRRWMADRDADSKDEAERLEARMHLGLANDTFDNFTDRPGDDHLGGRRLQLDREERQRSEFHRGRPRVPTRATRPDPRGLVNEYRNAA